jgi:hypothetical protein
VDCTQSGEFALAHWLVNGADGGRLFVRCFGGDGTVRENAAGDVLASLTTMVWNAPSKSCTGGATMADTSLNRRMTVRLGDAVAFAQIGIVGLDGQIEREALRLYGLPLAVLALLCCIVEEQRRGFCPGQLRHRIDEPPRGIARPARAFAVGSKLARWLRHRRRPAPRRRTAAGPAAAELRP